MPCKTKPDETGKVPRFIDSITPDLDFMAFMLELKVRKPES